MHVFLVLDASKRQITDIEGSCFHISTVVSSQGLQASGGLANGELDGVGRLSRGGGRPSTTSDVETHSSAMDRKH